MVFWSWLECQNPLKVPCQGMPQEREWVRCMAVWVFRSSREEGRCIFGEEKRTSKGLLMCQIHRRLMCIYYVPKKRHTHDGRGRGQTAVLFSSGVQISRVAADMTGGTVRRQLGAVMCPVYFGSS